MHDQVGRLCHGRPGVPGNPGIPHAPGHGEPAVRLKYIWVPPALLLALSLFTLAARPPQET